MITDPTITLLDKALKVTGSDNQTAKMIGISRQAISNIRHQGRPLTPAKVGMLAELIGERWTDHVLPALVAHSKSKADKEFWIKKFETLATIGAKGSAGVFLIIGAVFHSPNGNAAIIQESKSFVCTDYLLRTCFEAITSAISIARKDQHDQASSKPS